MGDSATIELRPAGRLRIDVTGHASSCEDSIEDGHSVELRISNGEQMFTPTAEGRPFELGHDRSIRLQGLPVGDYTVTASHKAPREMTYVLDSATVNIAHGSEGVVTIDLADREGKRSALDIVVNNASRIPLDLNATDGLRVDVFVEDDGALRRCGNLAYGAEWDEPVPGFSWQMHRACLGPGRFTLYLAPFGLAQTVELHEGDRGSVFFDVGERTTLDISVEGRAEGSAWLAWGAATDDPILHSTTPVDLSGDADVHVVIPCLTRPTWVQVVGDGVRSDRLTVVPDAAGTSTVALSCSATQASVGRAMFVSGRTTSSSSRRFLDSLRIRARRGPGVPYTYRVSLPVGSHPGTVLLRAFCSEPGDYDVHFLDGRGWGRVTLHVGGTSDPPIIQLK